MKKLSTSIILLTLLSSCTSLGSQTYEDKAFRFGYPSNWQTMVELYPDYQINHNYYWLMVEEIISVTSAQKPGDSGASFAVNWIELPSDMELEGMMQWSYAIVDEDIQSFNQASLRVAEQEGYVVRYQRHWGESWLQFQDVWLEKNKVVYLLSFNATDLTGYQKPIAAILESFTLK